MTVDGVSLQSYSVIIWDTKEYWLCFRLGVVAGNVDIRLELVEDLF